MKKTAADLLLTAADTIRQRGEERDSQDGERSMWRAVQTFNAMRDRHLTEEDGWWFMVCLKAARAFQGNFQQDDYVDGAAYLALAGECASGAKVRINTKPYPAIPVSDLEMLAL